MSTINAPNSISGEQLNQAGAVSWDIAGISIFDVVMKSAIIMMLTMATLFVTLFPVLITHGVFSH